MGGRDAAGDVEGDEDDSGWSPSLYIHSCCVILFPSIFVTINSLRKQIPAMFVTNILLKLF